MNSLFKSFLLKLDSRHAHTRVGKCICGIFVRIHETNVYYIALCRLSSVNHKIDSVVRDKDKATLKEYRTRKTNVEMAAYQLELINEVLELKNDFFRDQTRIREGAKLNQKLEKNIAQLRHRVMVFLTINKKNFAKLLFDCVQYNVGLLLIYDQKGHKFID